MGSIQSAVTSEESWKPLACKGGWGGQRTHQDLERHLEGPRFRFDWFPEVGRCCFGVLKWKMRRERVCGVCSIGTLGDSSTQRILRFIRTRVLGKCALKMKT